MRIIEKMAEELKRDDEKMAEELERDDEKFVRAASDPVECQALIERLSQQRRSKNELVSRHPRTFFFTLFVTGISGIFGEDNGIFGEKHPPTLLHLLVLLAVLFWALLGYINASVSFSQLDLKIKMLKALLARQA